MNQVGHQPADRRLAVSADVPGAIFPTGALVDAGCQQSENLLAADIRDVVAAALED